MKDSRLSWNRPNIQFCVHTARPFAPQWNHYHKLNEQSDLDAWYSWFWLTFLIEHVDTRPWNSIESEPIFPFIYSDVWVYSFDFFFIKLRFNFSCFQEVISSACVGSKKVKTKISPQQTIAVWKGRRKNNDNKTVTFCFAIPSWVQAHTHTEKKLHMRPDRNQSKTKIK